MWCVFSPLTSDPECCDGSDEMDGKKHCPNVCANVRKEYDRKKAEEKRVHDAGSKIRAKYIAKAHGEQRQRKEKLRSLKQELAKLEVEEERLRSIVESSESDEALVQEHKRQSRT